MRLFSEIAFLTVSRSNEDSSPKTIRPVQSTTRTPSFFRVASFSCITLLCGPRPTSVGTTPLPGDAPAYRLHGGFSKPVAPTGSDRQPFRKEVAKVRPELAGCEPDRDEKTAATIGCRTTASRTARPFFLAQT